MVRLVLGVLSLRRVGIDNDDERARRIKVMNMVVCICKGIPLSRVLPGLEGSKTVADVHRKVGTGCGGCKGERCGPRIKALLKKLNSED